MTKKSIAKDYHHGDLRASILKTADSILSRSGLEGLSMREVSRLLNVSHGAPYRHFPDKESILAGLAMEGLEQLSSEQESFLLIPEKAAYEKLKYCAASYLKFAARNPNRFRMMFDQFPSEALERHKALNAALQNNFGILSRAMEMAQKEGSVSQATPAPQLALVFWSMLHGFISLALSNASGLVRNTAVSLNVLEELCLESVLKGIAP